MLLSSSTIAKDIVVLLTSLGLSSITDVFKNCSED